MPVRDRAQRSRTVPGDGTLPNVDRTLVRALVRAQDWWAALASGKFSSVNALAKHEGFTGSYVTRITRLAFLAPEIVASIVEGQQPREITVRCLINGPPLPADWAEQVKVINERFR